MAKAWPALDVHVPGCDPQLQELVLAELDDYHPTAIQEPDDKPLLRAFFLGRSVATTRSHHPVENCLVNTALIDRLES